MNGPNTGGRSQRRSRRALESQVDAARSRPESALACYALALFHDNNSREAQAIPHYRRALALGLERETAQKALAWLASSLLKTGNRTEAKKALARALRIADDPQLYRFLRRLDKRLQGGSD